MNFRAEEGFTLVELILAIVITAVVAGVIATAVGSAVRVTDDTNRRLLESHDAQIASSYLDTDTMSAYDVAFDDATCSPSTPLVRFRWTDNGATFVASYFVQTVGSERRLTRNLCRDGVVVGTTALAHNLAASGTTVTCTPACAATGSSKPASVTLTLVDASGYSSRVTASRRVNEP